MNLDIAFVRPASAMMDDAKCARLIMDTLHGPMKANLVGAKIGEMI